MTWRCIKCGHDRDVWTKWACTTGGYCMAPALPATDPWDAFRPLALPKVDPLGEGYYGDPPRTVGVDPGQGDYTVVSTCKGFGGPTLKFRDISTAPVARRYLDGLMELADAYAAEEAPFNLDRGGR